LPAIIYILPIIGNKKESEGIKTNFLRFSAEAKSGTICFMTEAKKDRLDKIRETIRAFPTGPGVYLMKDAQDRVLYIGKAAGFAQPAASYFQPSARLAESRGAWIAEMVEKSRRWNISRRPAKLKRFCTRPG